MKKHRGKWRSASTWQDQVRTFVREVSPHPLDRVPVYCLDDSELPEAFRCGPRIGAYTNELLDVTLRDHIDPWEGRGFATVVSGETYFCPGSLPEMLMAIVAHELAHYVLFRVLVMQAGILELLTNDPTRMSPNIQRYANTTIASFVAPPGIDRTKDLPWVAHDSKFIWLCCHLEFRTWEWADIAQPHLGFAGPAYGLSPAVEYLRAAGTAPRDMAGASLFEVAATPPTDAIEELFESDCKAWRESHPEKERNG